MVAIALPAWFAAAELRSGHAFQVVGLLPLLAGFGLLLWCVRLMLLGWASSLASVRLNPVRMTMPGTTTQARVPRWLP